MNKAIIGLALGIAIVFASSVGSVTAIAEEQEYKPKAVVKKLVEGPLAGVDGKQVMVVHLQLPPGHVGGKHYHPGAVFVYVVNGSLTIETEDGKSQTVSAGELYQEPLRQVIPHRRRGTRAPRPAWNLSCFRLAMRVSR